MAVIVVVGEVLVDLVVGADGSVEAALGGAPYNTARAAARLGADVEFVGGLSLDRFGRMADAQLAADGVGTGLSVETDSPSTLAVVEIGDGGAASYRFYLVGTAAPQVDADAVVDAVALVRDGGIFFTGGLGLVLEPLATSILEGLMALDDSAILVVDINCRPTVVTDRDTYVARVLRAVERADVVKVSDEDLAFLAPDREPDDAVTMLLEAGACVVVVTAGAAHTTVHDERRSIAIDVPAITGDIVDTIGAGDTFAAGLLAWCVDREISRDDISLERLVDAVAVGHAAAGIVVTRRGADPPYRSELAGPGGAWSAPGS